MPDVKPPLLRCWSNGNPYDAGDAWWIYASDFHRQHYDRTPKCEWAGMREAGSSTEVERPGVGIWERTWVPEVRTSRSRTRLEPDGFGLGSCSKMTTLPIECVGQTSASLHSFSLELLHYVYTNNYDAYPPTEFCIGVPSKLSFAYLYWTRQYNNNSVGKHGSRAKGPAVRRRDR